MKLNDKFGYPVGHYMEKLMEYVLAYRASSSLETRIELANLIFPVIEPDLRFFVFNQIQQPAAEDVLQHVLISVAGSLQSFQGSRLDQFRSWFYQIARRRMYDHLRKKKSDRLQPIPLEEIIEEADGLIHNEAVPLEVRDELEYALRLLKRSKPDCVKYLLKLYIDGLHPKDIAREQNIAQAAAQRRIDRCLEKAQSLVA